MDTPYAPRQVSFAWAAAGWAGATYGVFLTALAFSATPGDALTGHWVGQPAFKTLMAVLLAVAAAGHPIRREARWLVPALMFSAAGDWLLAIPWWEPSFVAGLSAFLLAHLCFLGALIPRAVVSGPGLIGVGVVCVSCVGLLDWFWPGLVREGMTVPVVVYVAVLAAMVCAALLADLPTRWTAVGAVCFAVSDAMIAISRFVLRDEVLAVPVWWTYAAAQVLITAGFFFGRSTSEEQSAE
ncbi:lysoplasmalogenase [Mycolicibacter sp. MYC123]|uniref:Lysoplasmalogenase n=1 Tax=[Mycobacterium] zoologicum TaxID=2872311 RepID=A0ABU5YFP7_9MYCO|nr:lysoplasmalogenase [Mycolicibacter sp. MYC123]MEB3048671.1 lysoplasmalogenase [Mycolicibacter sp. MYC123]